MAHDDVILDYVPPGETVERTLEVAGTDLADRTHVWEMEYHFIDAAQKIWVRDRFGRLYFEEDLNDPTETAPATQWQRPYRLPTEAADE